ncbi:LapA family protein [Mastigocoleus sp. MO_188.B34]|uniref:LapA family protein n=1 Tax=Mastigocoleus sp. MO_188.B34 TaxID=3036635 RepID=UPI00260DA713|nr:LapA family protein [Mastigocoleus sp. MO_188.B34]MDJ0694162.1 LapA family protein [Mastigocoleus sp. MO_188.B34]
MSVNRWIFLVVVLGGLTLFIAQNLSVVPPLPLVFLGVQTQALPLSIWILISIIAGAIAYELIASLLKLPNIRQPQDTFKSFSNRRDRQTKTSTRGYSQRYSTAAESRSEDNSTSPPRDTNRNQTRQYDSYDSWENAGEVDDWDFEDEREETSAYYQDTKVRDTNTSRNNQTTRSRSNDDDFDSDSDFDSGYSYNSREEKNSGVGRAESIYDADYRVITSPYKSSSAEQFDEAKNQEEDYDDEWDFLEDDDFEVKDKRPQK